MKTIKLTAEEIRMLGIQMEPNACAKGCPLDHIPRLPKTKSGIIDCYARNKNGEYICPFQRAMDRISDKLFGEE